MKVWLNWLGIALLALGISVQTQAKTTDGERKIGKESADEIAKDKTVKFVTDPAMVERVERVGKVVAAAAETFEPDLTTYTFHIIDSKEVNAFSLPGGYIYLNKGLIDRCESDDELAGVLGHEIAHAANHHMRQLMAKSKKFDWATLAIILAGAATGKDVGNAALMAQVVTQAQVNGYGMKFESEADRYSVEYLMKTPYNPVGTLTFMEKLARDDSRRGGQVDMGIYQDHPLSKDRVEALIKLLNQKGIPIDRRKVTSTLQVSAKETKMGTQPAAEVWLGKILITSLAADGSIAPLARAQAVANRLDSLLNQKLSVMDVHLGPEEQSVWVGKSMLLKVTPDDAKLNGKTEEEIAKQAQKNIQGVLWKENYDLIF